MTRVRGEKRTDARRITELGLLTCVSLIIFTVELQLPNPFPVAGIKVGLANIVTVYAVYRFRPRETAIMLISRIILGCLLTGNLAAMIYSLAGGLACLGAMLPVRNIISVKDMPLCSVIGAAAHGLGQLAAACIVMRTFAVLAYLPFILPAGCTAGAFTGLCAQMITKRTDLRRDIT